VGRLLAPRSPQAGVRVVCRKAWSDSVGSPGWYPGVGSKPTMKTAAARGGGMRRRRAAGRSLRRRNQPRLAADPQRLVHHLLDAVPARVDDVRVRRRASRYNFTRRTRTAHALLLGSSPPVASRTNTLCPFPCGRPSGGS